MTGSASFFRGNQSSRHLRNTRCHRRLCKCHKSEGRNSLRDQKDVCTQTRAHTYTHAYTHTHARTCVYTHVCTHMHAHTYTQTRTRTRTHLHACTRACTRTHVRTHLHTRTHMHAHTLARTHARTHMCTHTYTRAHTHTYTHTRIQEKERTWTIKTHGWRGAAGGGGGGPARLLGGGRRNSPRSAVWCGRHCPPAAEWHSARRSSRKSNQNSDNVQLTRGLPGTSHPGRSSMAGGRPNPDGVNAAGRRAILRKPRNPVCSERSRRDRPHLAPGSGVNYRSLGLLPAGRASRAGRRCRDAPDRRVGGGRPPRAESGAWLRPTRCQ